MGNGIKLIILVSILILVIYTNTLITDKILNGLILIPIMFIGYKIGQVINDIIK